MAVQLLTTIYRGDTKQFAFTFKNKEGLTFDISGHKIFFGMKSSLSGAEPLAVSVVHVAGSGLQDDPVNGRAVLSIPSDQTALLDPSINGTGEYYYEFQHVVPGTPDEVRTLEQGKVKVLRDVIQATS